MKKIALPIVMVGLLALNLLLIINGKHARTDLLVIVTAAILVLLFS